eukprot:TRINITY_DN6078_c0_g1_i1.p1 TRINITY_DN6078_c0_g1~~TRINITY_DN6078_c0_g1_i1.p1  ORF type:complete len:540 (+),score=106.62 TRINITY_DN6078_c0_g1_i1:38-1621(+)
MDLDGSLSEDGNERISATNSGQTRFEEQFDDNDMERIQDEMGSYTVDQRVTEALSISGDSRPNAETSREASRPRAEAFSNSPRTSGTSEGAEPPSNGPSSSSEVLNQQPSLSRRKYANEDVSSPEWMNHHKHIFVLSSAGRPIYSRYGDENDLSPFMASLTAMVLFVQDMEDNLRYIVAGDYKFVFLVKGAITLVSAGKTHEPVSQVTQQLNYLYSQVISILTAGVNQIFERRANFDLRNLLGGTDRFLDNLSSLMDHDSSFILNAVHPLRLDISVRSSIASTIQAAKTPDLLYACIVGKYQLVSLVRPKRFLLQPADIHLIMNFVNASTAFKSGESWTPLCLPKFNDQGFLHAYICYLAEDVCLLLMSAKQDSFFEFATCKNTIVQGLTKSGALDAIIKSVKNNLYSVSEVGIPQLLHFFYKSKGNTQSTTPRLEGPYVTRQEKKRLFRMYQRIHKRIHKFKRPHKVQYQIGQSETMVGWVTDGFELYATFSPLEPRGACIKSCNDILKWIKGEESSLFILDSPVW